MTTWTVDAHVFAKSYVNQQELENVATLKTRISNVSYEENNTVTEVIIC